MLPTYPTFEGYTRKVMTLTMIIKDDEILLGMKNRGMGKGKWNGFGGKVEPNEAVIDGAVREVKEECGLDVNSIRKIGIIEFEYAGSKELLEGHIYICDDFSGDIIESDEMAPIKWFKIEEEPDSMWIDHKFWFPVLLKQVPFKAHFLYLNDDTMLDSTIILLDSFKKTKETCVNVVIKKDNKILLCKDVEDTTYFNKHERVEEESVENAAMRCLKNNFGLADCNLRKIAVADVETIDKPYVQEINVFVVDVSKLTTLTQIEGSRWLDIDNIPVKNSWPDNKFFTTLFKMKPFNAYFLLDENNLLCSKYDTICESV